MPREDKQKILKFLKIINLEKGINTKENLINIFGSRGSLENILRKIRKIRLESEKAPFILQKSKKYLYVPNSALDEYLTVLMSGQVKKIEAIRYAKIIEFLKKKKLTIEDITEGLNNVTSHTKNCPIEIRTTRNYLNLLVKDGFIEKLKSNRLVLYNLKKGIDSLDENILIKLYLFLDFFTKTGISITRSLIIKYIIEKRINNKKLKKLKETINYKHSRIVRLFDDLILLYLLEILQSKKIYELELALYSKSKSSGIKNIKVMPFCLIFDYRLARWYLIASGPTKKILIDSILDIKKVNVSKTLSNDEFNKRFNAIKKTWLVEEDSVEKEVELKFYFENTSNSENFILKRVTKEIENPDIKFIDNNTFILKTSVRELKEIKPWIRSFGSSIEVLKPEKLQNEIVKEFQFLESVYSSILKKTKHDIQNI
ncbi:hypothetical protein Thena_1737 [Thermodesulfobium narugense DSM 14796]|uniref:WCX domain-containing protein n=1 Tax=Thermodesulfobium narugense DSM 14796 TaxID=747365 RepID=M1E9I6_9BACT|nr:WYL domain-containing protein [Thermodesulfobium narugense]AEE15344.1 hypothetical protein Thena_1737 [Thermodesulfobium narugense DSM 14796]